MKTTTFAPWKGALTLLAALALPASAARLAYEGFDYTEADGTAITGLNGGTGWDEAFPAPASGTMAVQPGLSYSGITTVGKAMRWNPSAYTKQGRDWEPNPIAAPANGTYWFSVIVNANGISQGNFNWMYSTKDATFGQNGVGFRTSNSSGALNFIPINPNTDGTGGPQAGTGTAGTPTFIVGRLTLTAGSDSSFRIWVNPSTDPNVIPGDSDSNSSATTVAAADTSTLRASISGRAFGSGGGTATNYIEFDEIRIGTSFAEVLPAAAGTPEFSLNPATAVQGQVLNFAWSNLPAGSNPTLNGNSVTIDGSGNGGTTLLAPATNTTYTLAWTGAGSPLTQNFTAVAPFFTLAPSTGYLGDTMTLNWRVPVSTLPAITAVTLTPDVGTPVDLTGDTISTTGVGTKTLPVPSATTVYTLSYTFNGNSFSLPTQTFTLLPSFLNVSDYAITDVSPVSMTWRIPPGWDENSTTNTVELQYGTPADFTNTTYSTKDLTPNTNATTGAGSFPQTLLGDTDIVPSAGQTQFRIAYYIADTVQYLTDTVELQAEILTNLSFTGSLQTQSQFFPVVNNAPMNNGVKAYSDRDHIWAQVPSILQGAQFVKLAQGDKAAPEFTISFTAAQTATFFLLLDNRIGDNVGGTTPATGTDSPPLLPNSANTMAWVLDSGFVDSGLDIGLDEGANATIDQSYSVYFRQVSKDETFTFYQQNDTSTGDANFRNMYGIAAVSPQIVPVAFVANPGTINEGQSTTLQWTVPVGATASIDQGIGPVSVDAVGVGSKIVSPTTTTTYKLTYVLGANPPVELAPVTVTVNATTSPFASWMSTNFPAITAPNNTADADPDGDGISNLGEFAFSGNPGSGSDDGLTRSAIDNISGTNHLTLTFACRTGATFTGAGPVTASKDGVDYTVRASTDLSAFTVAVDEVAPITTGLPDPAPAGYSYRTFRVTAAQSANAKAFMQAIAAPTPTP